MNRSADDTGTMSVQEDDDAAGPEPDRLRRHDSFYGDAEKVSNDKSHGTGVSLSALAIAVSLVS